MKCTQASAAVTARTISVEGRLSLAAGAPGLAFFPSDWQPSVGAVLRRITRRIRQLQAPLLAPAARADVSSSSPSVRVGARVFGGAFYVIAVNAGATTADAMVAADALGDRTLTRVDGAGRLAARGGELALTLPPLSVRIYAAPPG